MEEFNAAPFTRNRPFVAPQEQQDKLEQQIQNTLSQVPLLKTVLKHLDQKIADTGSIRTALQLAETHKISKEDALIALDIVSQQLSIERGYILARIETVAKRKS